MNEWTKKVSCKLASSILQEEACNMRSKCVNWGTYKDPGHLTNWDPIVQRLALHLHLCFRNTKHFVYVWKQFSTTTQRATMWWLWTVEATMVVQLRVGPRFTRQEMIRSHSPRVRTTSSAVSRATARMGWRSPLMLPEWKLIWLWSVIWM